MQLEWDLFSALVTAFLAVGVVDDLRTRKIHNKLVLSILGLAILCLVITALFATPITPQPFVQIFLHAAQSFGLALVFGLALFALKVWGGGDAKLFLAVSPLLIASEIPIFLLWSLVWGALLGLMIAALNGKMFTMLMNLRVAVAHRKEVPEKSLTKVPFSVALFFGHLSVMFLRQIGGL